MNSTSALACVVCIPYPKETHADAIIANDVVVLARENPDKPFTLAIVEVLKGSTVDFATQIFLPSQIRMKLQRNPTHSIVLVQRRAANSWDWLSYATPAYLEFVHDVLAHETDWQGNRGQRPRFLYFTERLHDSDLTVRQQAILEIGRAPYAWVKVAAGKIPFEKVRATLADWQLIEWHSLYILLLAQSPACQ